MKSKLSSVIALYSRTFLKKAIKSAANCLTISNTVSDWTPD